MMFPPVWLEPTKNGGGGNRTRVVFPPEPRRSAGSRAKRGSDGDGLALFRKYRDALPRFVNTKGVAFLYVARVSELATFPDLPDDGFCVCCPKLGDAWYLFDRDKPQPFQLCDDCFSETVYGKKGVIAGVYFVRAGDFVKIGHSIDIAKRMKELSTGCPYPLELWKHIHGSYQIERALHKQFADERAEGEWFRLSDRLRDYIEALA